MRTTLLGIGLSVMALASTARADEKLYACREPAPTAKIAASFEANVALKDLVIWASRFTCKNVVFSAEVERAVSTLTIVTPKEMTPTQALGLFVDSLEALGLVVTIKPDSIVLKLGPKMPVKCDPAVAAVAAPPTASDPADAELEKRLDAGIKKIDETHYTIDKDLLDQVLVNPMMVAKGARIVPAVKPAGFKLYAVRPRSLFARIGFANGDTVTEVNGFPVDSAQKALEVYTKLRDATALEFNIVRGGKSIKLALSVK